MHELPLLINIAAALVAAFFGGLIARRLGLPTIVGYLLAGIAIGPFTPGFVGDVHTINQLAELGVIFLMFGVGLHFSFRDLWKVRDMAIPGAIVQMTLATLLGFGLSQLWGWSPAAGLVLGLAVSVASTVVLLRGLMDNGLLNSAHGQVAVGWLVLEDLATVIILVLLPALASKDGADWAQIGGTLLKAGGFVAFMLFIGVRAVPWLLLRIARTGSRELFILAVLAIALGTALGAAELFGVSLALGAFLAGVVVAESPLSHQVGADLVPFREAFAVVFFVSIGMLVNPGYLAANLGHVISLSLLIIIGKALITTMLGGLFPRPARTALVVAAGLSQIGEFSFILGQAGLALGLLEQDQYSLILAGALISITINPAMFRLIDPAERVLRRWPRVWQWLDRHGPAPAMIKDALANHVVIVGHGRVGRHIVNVLEQVEAPTLVIESDAERVEALNRRGVPTLYGDAANSEVLDHAGLDRARALVVTVPDEAAAEMIVAAARARLPDLHIIARAATEVGVRRLAQLGAQDVIHPELEGGLEIVRRTLLELGCPLREVDQYAEAIRHDQYALADEEPELRALHRLQSSINDLAITWLQLPNDSVLIGQTLDQANLRARTRASVVAIVRERQVLANPKSGTVFQVGDRIGLLGEPAQIADAEQVINAVAVIEETESARAAINGGSM